MHIVLCNIMHIMLLGIVVTVVTLQEQWNAILVGRRSFFAFSVVLRNTSHNEMTLNVSYIRTRWHEPQPIVHTAFTRMALCLLQCDAIFRVVVGRRREKAEFWFPNGIRGTFNKTHLYWFRRLSKSAYSFNLSYERGKFDHLNTEWLNAW